MFHSYILFPVIVYLLSRNKHNNRIAYSTTDYLPNVSVIISVFNEEKVIEHRISNVFLTSYPIDKLEVIIGSDGSTDSTNEILQQLREKFPSVHVFLFDQRKGKGNVLNNLIKQASGEIIIFSDAKVEFSDQVIFQLVKNFKNQEIGFVGGNIVNRHVRKDGISIQEKRFMSNEIIIKYNEGRIWGMVMGAYGACFAFRKEHYIQIPESFAVEDFYLSLKILEKGYKGIINLSAICYEDVPNRISEEFRRKVRISTGNFQNMKVFYHLFKKINPLAFCFFSHKVIRWYGPFLLITAFISNIFLVWKGTFYASAMALQVFLIIIPIIDFFLQKIHLHSITLRFVTHFYSMNLALLIGFIKYWKGVKTNVWEPTTRSY
jgi:cellulose synthase/poly-beta-1,6-N-acetylglucosamine synthase-like glycosyltransferase